MNEKQKRVFDNKVKLLTHITKIQEQTSDVKLSIGGVNDKMVMHDEITIHDAPGKIIENTIRLIDNMENAHYSIIENREGLTIHFY